MTRGFIGPNGAGKTTTLKCLSDFSIRLQELLRCRFTRLSEKMYFLNKFLLSWDRKSALVGYTCGETFFLNKEIYEISDEQYKKIYQFLWIFWISELLHVAVRKLSLGERMKMELVAALLHSPKVCFLTNRLSDLMW